MGCEMGGLRAEGGREGKNTRSLKPGLQRELSLLPIAIVLRCDFCCRSLEKGGGDLDLDELRDVHWKPIGQEDHPGLRDVCPGIRQRQQEDPWHSL